jgi:peptide/nickel transport system permease protein
MTKRSTRGIAELTRQTQQAVAEGRLDEARQLVLELLTLDRGNVAAWELQARLAREPETSRLAWQRVLKLAPDHPVAPLFLDSLRDRARAGAPPSEPAGRRPRGHGLLISTAAFVLQRLLFGALVLVAIIFLSYLGLGMARGQAFTPAVSESVPKTFDYLGRLINGELGVSQAASVTQVPLSVAEVVPALLGRSLGLLAAALLTATVVALLLGVWAAHHRNSSWSLSTILASIVGVSVPSFFAALLLQWAVIRITRTTGRPVLPVGGYGWDTHLILPTLVLAARPIAQITRVTFISVSEALEQPHVRTARSKGLRDRYLLVNHVIRNAAIPILTTIGLSLRFSLSSLPLVEFFFGWPGTGFHLLRSISRRDDNLTVILFLCLGTLFILVNLVLEIAYRFIDPRMREPASDRASREGIKITEVLRSVWGALRELLADNPLKQWLARRSTAAAPSPFRSVLVQNGADFEISGEEYRAERQRAWVRGTVTNLAFVAGAILVVGLIIIFFFGPQLSPHSPYTTQGLTYAGGELSVPPFPPDATHPWGTDVLGRDIMSLILAGAQQTLLLVTLVVATRLVVGFALGALAGWLSGSWVDRLVLALAETIAAFPTMLLGMTLILALGILQGFRPFVIALCFVGWGEVMQFVRGEVMSIRPKPFIESAVAVGLRTPRIIMNHVLPNLLPALISIAALEMGAVLMLLGELGFVGIFIGGGAYAELEIDAAPYHYSDVPEWGALLSNVRRYARAYYWTAFYPSLAFFVAILGFNLFGEGVRRMVETVGFRIGRLVNRYTLAASLVAIVGVGWVQANTGSQAFYQLQAGEFDGQHALSYVEALTDPALDGQALGSSGLGATAEYIAGEFQNLGLQAAGQEFTYFQTRNRSFELLPETPVLAFDDGGQPLVYHQDYVEYPGPYRLLGQVEGNVHALAIGKLIGGGQWYTAYPALEALDLHEKVLLIPSESDIGYLQRIPFAALLVVADDPLDLERHYTLSSTDPRWHQFGTDRYMGRDRPIMWISEKTADRILQGTGYTVTELRSQQEGLDVDEVLSLPLELKVSLDVQGIVIEKVPVRHVIGHLPGTYDSDMPGGMADHLIMVLAQYDTPPDSPDGVRYPAANDNASGVAVMLEAIRNMQQTGYQPYRTFLFVAYSAEGREGGELVFPPEVDRFLTAKKGFSTNYDIEAIVDLRGLGAGQGDDLIISAGGSLRLAELFEASARHMDVPVHRGGEAIDLSIVFEERSRGEGGQEAPMVALSWEGWEMTSRLPGDTLESISADNLEQAGRALSLGLMILGREINY